MVNDAITAATGSTGDYHAALAKLGAQRTAEAGPLYDKAFSEPLTPEQTAAATAAQRFAQGPVGDKALQNGMRVIQTEKMTANQPFNPADYGVTAKPGGAFRSIRTRLLICACWMRLRAAMTTLWRVTAIRQAAS